MHAHRRGHGAGCFPGYLCPHTAPKTSAVAFLSLTHHQALGTTLGRIGLGSGVVLGGGTIIYNSVKGEPVSNEDTTTDSIPWVAKLAAKSEEMHTPGQVGIMILGHNLSCWARQRA